jgi:hypothetical protein
LDRILDLLDRYWKWVVVAAWLAFCTWFVITRWNVIIYFGLPDTDDNLRISQVRALLAGQDWFDLRQYRLNPPFGANIHWSRLVDLPLAGLILLFRPLVGGADAERIAIAVAPMLPLLLLFLSLALLVRRLIDRRAYPLAFVASFYAASSMGMFMPARIDHHGWQLALLALAVAGIADPKRARGGAVVGAATALSFAIGLEMMIYLVLAGAAMTLFWVADAGERRRLAAYAATAGGGTALAFLVFASYANRLPVCDALSPVWLSDVLLGTALLLGLAMFSPPDWRYRLGLAVGAGLVVAAFHALAWPQCLSRLEGVSPEVEQLWLSHVREARPLYRHGARTAALIAALPVTGVIGWILLAWWKRRDWEAFRRTAAAGLPCLAATVLLLWQTRTGPAAQILAVPGAVALIWLLVPLISNSKHLLVRTLGTAVVVVIGFGAAAPMVSNIFPPKKPTPREVAVDKANRQCTSLGGLRPIAMQPKGMVFTFVDLGPRLITVTHHYALTGPYHRNGEQIADGMKAFRGSESQAHAIIDKYHSDYLLICPNMSTATIFMAEAPRGFYAQLVKGRAPAWLDPVQLPKDSPFRMWRVRR